MQTTVIEIPVELKPAVESLIKAATAAATLASTARSLDCLALESEAQDAAAACERAVLAYAIQAADIDTQRIRIEGREFSKAMRGEVEYQTAAGTIRVERTLYRERRNGPTVDPIAVKLGMVNKTWLPGAAAQMAGLLANGPSRDAKKTATKMGRLPYSRSSFERVGHAVAQHYVAQHADVDEVLINAYDLPRAATAMIASLDRVSVPMEEPRTRPPGRPRKGAAKRPIERNFRMAYCGSLTLLDEEGKPIHKICYGRMPKGDPVDLVDGMASDALALLRQRPELHVTVVNDGAPGEPRAAYLVEPHGVLFSPAATLTVPGVAPYRLIDLFHLLEKLNAAAVSLHGEDEAKVMCKRWSLRLTNSSTAALRILNELRTADNGSDAVHEAITYIENNHGLMNYATAKAEGRPLGSGAVEATCKSLVSLRMKRPGARWHDDTGEHIVQLRALDLSDRWSQAMLLTLRPLRRAVAAAA